MPGEGPSSGDLYPFLPAASPDGTPPARRNSFQGERWVQTFPNSFVGIGQSSSAVIATSVWIASKVKPAAVREAKRPQILEQGPFAISGEEGI